MTRNSETNCNARTSIILKTRNVISTFYTLYLVLYISFFLFFSLSFFFFFFFEMFTIFAIHRGNEESMFDQLKMVY